MEHYGGIYPLRRPVVCLAFFYVLGTYAGLVSDVSAGRLFSCGIILWLLTFIFLIRRASFPDGSYSLNGFTRSLSLFGCIVMTAWLAASLHSDDSNDDWLTRSYGLAGEHVEVTGVVDSDPDLLPAFETNRIVAQFKFAVKEIRKDEVPLFSETRNIKVMYYGSSDFDVPLYGERWQIFGKVYAGRPKGEDSRQLRALPPCIKADAAHARRVWKGEGWWLAEGCYSTRRAAAEMLSAGIEDHSATVDVLHSLILGYRRLSRQMREIYIFTGTLHIFAISGSHVVVFGSIIICVLGMLRVSSVYWGLFLGPLLCAYVFATGLQSSAVRACIMALIYWGAPLLGRRADGLSALCVSAVLILAVVPTQLLNAGFILSFVCVLGLIVLYQPINTPVQKLLEPDPLRLQPESKTVVILRSVGRVIWSTIAMSLAAWLASAPLTAYYFGNFTPMGLAANLIVIPVSFFVILTGCLSLVFGSCIYWFAVTFNHANLALIGIMMNSMELLAKVPYGNIKIENFPIWGIFAWYGLLAGLVFWHKCRLVDSKRDCGNSRGDAAGD